ncbi:DNA primase large subunit [Methanococcus maripaludis]|uniref:DNA primase large subunit n=1 Tax=Methanococcus maripaludis TaxID=39152 RepID=A0A7J9NWA8_METMI|nr:hypothetical protein [Methanococcus maripaludis]MBA2851601.1 DNA primase large subunit [Methanococcus maripaludis]
MDHLDKIKDMDLNEILETEWARETIKLYLRTVFKMDFEELYNREIKGDPKSDVMIQFVSFILMCHTPYINPYITRLTQKIGKTIEVPSKIDIWEFIAIASKSHDNDLDLCRFDVDDGVVYFKTKEEKLLFGESIVRTTLRERAEKIKKMDIPEIGHDFLRTVDVLLDLKTRIRSRRNRIKLDNFDGEINGEMYPPCIKNIIMELETGGSPHHYARRSLVPFLFAAKFNPNLRLFEDDEVKISRAVDYATDAELEEFIKDIVELFKDVRDFNEEKTVYYLKNNLGITSDKIMHCEYCKNWRNNGLEYYCTPDVVCGRRDVAHPLDYLIVKAKNSQKAEENKK